MIFCLTLVLCLLSFSAYIISSEYETKFLGLDTVGKKALIDSNDEALHQKGIPVRKVQQTNPSKLSLLEKHKNVLGSTQQLEYKITKADRDTAAKLSQEELERFREHFKNWPKTKPKAAIYVLTSRIEELRSMLQSLDKYFNDRFHYPVIVFHEIGITELIPQIRSFTSSSLFFQLVTFEVPSFINQPVPENISCHSTIAYRHMCRFNAKLVYEEATIKELEYYWRLDDDSLILSPIPYDVFVYMRDKELHYGYFRIINDKSSCVYALWHVTGRYIKENNIQPTFFKQWHHPMIYYNNFEISSTRLWMSREFKDYIEYLDRLGGIFYFRWGDAPIHSLALSLFLPKNQTHEFLDIRYTHQGISRFPVMLPVQFPSVMDYDYLVGT